MAAGSAGSRAKFGLTIDNLLSAEVVTANGELLRTSPAENPDLFWALRGGGGNFGIVTSFEFQLHELGQQVISGLVVHPFADAAAVLEQYRQALEGAPDELTWISHAREKISPLIGISESGQTISGEKS